MRCLDVKNKSILLKSVICGLLYFAFNLLIIPAEYILNFSLYSASVLGTVCGILVAIVLYCDTMKRTLQAIGGGLLSIILTDFILGWIPYRLLEYIFRNDSAIQEIGHLTVNELISYNWGRLLFFMPGLLISFIISISLIAIINRKKSI